MAFFSHQVSYSPKNGTLCSNGLICASFQRISEVTFLIWFILCGYLHV